MRALQTVAIVALMLFTLALVLIRALDAPQVFVNDLSGECIEVRDPAAEHEGRKPYTCATLPEHYEEVKTSRTR